MADTLQVALWLLFFYGLGAIGLVSIGAMPLRALAHGRRFRTLDRSRRLIAGLGIAVVVAMALAVQPLLQLGRCLLGYHCSANAAGGWINAALLGAIYVVFEFVLLGLRKIESAGEPGRD